MPHPRRQFIHASAGLIVGGVFASAFPASLSAQTAPAAPASKAPPKPPALAAEKVQAVVGQSHRNLDKVRELVAEDPLLVNACWDWGGGDFETPLQAAAHTGRREIAEFLLSQNAHLDMYAVAMLGMLDVLKATLVAMPQLASVPGPHGFTLLHCAKQGGEKAKPVYDFLVAQGVPEIFKHPLLFKFPAS